MGTNAITFDGRAYHYRQYSYDRLADAEAYALIDQARAPGQARDEAPIQWRQYSPPTPEEAELMQALGIRYEGARYRFGPYRYDLLDDAVRYARSAPQEAI